MSGRRHPRLSGAERLRRRHARRRLLNPQWYRLHRLRRNLRHLRRPRPAGFWATLSRGPMRKVAPPVQIPPGGRETVVLTSPCSGMLFEPEVSARGGEYLLEGVYIGKDRVWGHWRVEEGTRIELRFLNPGVEPVYLQASVGVDRR